MMSSSQWTAASSSNSASRHCPLALARSRPIQPHGASEAARAVDPLRSRRGQPRAHSSGRLLNNRHRGTFLSDSLILPASRPKWDADYGRNLDRDGAPTRAFEPSLFVWATVMSHPTQDRAIVDAGLKALAFDCGLL